MRSHSILWTTFWPTQYVKSVLGLQKQFRRPIVDKHMKAMTFNKIRKILQMQNFSWAMVSSHDTHREHANKQIKFTTTLHSAGTIHQQHKINKKALIRVQTLTRLHYPQFSIHPTLVFYIVALPTEIYTLMSTCWAGLIFWNSHRLGHVSSHSSEMSTAGFWFRSALCQQTDSTVFPDNLTIFSPQQVSHYFKNLNDWF